MTSQAETKEMDTSNILFICSGAFPGLTDQRARRGAKNRKVMGFGAEREDEREEEGLREVTVEELVGYGMLPEFLGRLPVTVTLRELTEDELARILTEPKNSVCSQYQLAFRADGVKLVFTEGALEEIAAEAIRRGCGARGLRSIVEKMLLETMYYIPGRPDVSRCIVDRETVRTGKVILENPRGERRRAA